MSKVLVVGNFGAGNVGDELILQGILALREELSFEPLVVSGKPKETSKRYGVRSYPRLPFGIRSFLSFSWVRTLRVFFSADFVFLGGGGLFVDRFFTAPLMWGTYGVLAVVFRKPLFLLGHSFEIRKNVTRALLRFLCKRARFVSVRDGASLRALSDLGIDASKCFLFPDLSFLARTGCGRRGGEKTVGISLCRWGMSKKSVSEIVSFVRYCFDKGFKKIKLFVFQVGRDDDENILNEVLSFLPQQNVEIVSAHREDFMKEYSSVSFVLGMRLHSLLLAYSLQIPFTAIAYQDKVRNSLEDLGLGSYCFPVNNFSAGDLCAAMNLSMNDEKFFVKREEIHNKMRKLSHMLSIYL